MMNGFVPGGIALLPGLYWSPTRVHEYEIDPVEPFDQSEIIRKAEEELSDRSEFIGSPVRMIETTIPTMRFLTVYSEEYDEAMWTETTHGYNAATIFDIISQVTTRVYWLKSQEELTT